METRPRRPKPPRPPLTWRKLFHWGIVFWLLVWLGSVCLYHRIASSSKSGERMYLEVGDGTIRFISPSGSVFLPTNFSWSHWEIWEPSRLKRIRECPEILLAKLGRLEISKTAGLTHVGFPFAGFLWLWLAAGLYGEIKLIRLPCHLPDGAHVAIQGSRRKIAMTGAAMLAVSAFIVTVEWIAGKSERRCAEQCGRMEQELENRKVTTPAVWRGNPDGREVVFLGECPGETPHSISGSRVEGGKYVVLCPRVEHERYRLTHEP